MNRFVMLSLLAIAGLAVCFNVAVAGFSYSETFATEGVQATEDLETFANYPAWTYGESGPASGTAQANVAVAGTLRLENPGGVNPETRQSATIGAQAIVGQPTFDLSTNPLKVSVDMGGAANESGYAGYYAPGLSVGNVNLEFYPEWPTGAANLGVGGTWRVYEANLGFNPASGQQCSTSLTIAPAGDNYDITAAIDAWSYTLSVPKSEVGDVSTIKLYSIGNGVADGVFSNFSATDVPEPGALALLASCGIGLLAYAWRRRR